ncbi:MAG: RNA polymerase sigma factor [Acidimicrobiales bacterium]
MVMGSEADFRALFDKAYPALRRYAWYRNLTKDDAEDLVAGTFEVAWRRIQDVPRDDPMPWLYAVAHNLWRNHLRSAGRRSELIRVLPPPEPRADIADDVVSESRQLREALAKLSGDDQELLMLVAWDGLSPSEAAVVLGCSPVAARTRLHRARNRLASHLGVDLRMQREDSCGQLNEATTDHMPASGGNI